MEMRRIRARVGFVIEFLASKVRRSDAAALGQVDKPTSGARRCAGTEEKIGCVGSSDRSECCRRQSRVNWRGRRDKLSGSGAVMAEGKADLAIIMGPTGRFGTRCRCRQDGGRASRRKRMRVVVPGEECRLKDDCKNTEQRGPAPRGRHPRSVRQDSCRQAQLHGQSVPSAA